MISWKSLLLAAWSLFWGYVNLRLLQAIVFPTRQVCQGFGNEVHCSSEWYTPSFSESAPLGVILFFAIIALYLAVRSLFSSIHEDRLRLQALTDAASSLDVRRKRILRRHRLRGDPG